MSGDEKWVMKDEVLLVLQSGADILVCVPWIRLNFASDNGQWRIALS